MSVIPQEYINQPSVLAARKTLEDTYHAERAAQGRTNRDAHNELFELIRRNHRWEEGNDIPSEELITNSKCDMMKMLREDLLRNATVRHLHGKTCDPNSACGSSHSVNLNGHASKTYGIHGRLLRSLSTQALVGIWSLVEWGKPPSDDEIAKCLRRCDPRAQENITATFDWADVKKTHMVLILRSTALADCGTDAEAKSPDHRITLCKYYEYEQARLEKEKMRMSILAGKILRLRGPNINCFSRKLANGTHVVVARNGRYTRSGTFAASTVQITMNTSESDKMGGVHVRYDGRKGTVPMMIKTKWNVRLIPLRLIELAGQQLAPSYIAAAPCEDEDEDKDKTPTIRPPCQACTQMYMRIGRKLELSQ